MTRFLKNVRGTNGDNVMIISDSWAPYQFSVYKQKHEKRFKTPPGGQLQHRHKPHCYLDRPISNSQVSAVVRSSCRNWRMIRWIFAAFQMMNSTVVSASPAKQTIIAVAAVNQLWSFIRAARVLFCSDGGDETQIAVCAELAGAKLWRGSSLKGWSLSKLLVLIKATCPAQKWL